MMTMEATIVNTSNWDGENINVGGKVLKPGESIAFGLDHGEGSEERVSIVSKPDDAVVPFDLKGKGVERACPTVIVVVGTVQVGPTSQ